jgi:paired amphipathic helix protein Sin3a
MSSHTLFHVSPPKSSFGPFVHLDQNHPQQLSIAELSTALPDKVSVKMQSNNPPGGNPQQPGKPGGGLPARGGPGAEQGGLGSLVGGAGRGGAQRPQQPFGRSQPNFGGLGGGAGAGGGPGAGGPKPGPFGQHAKPAAAAKPPGPGGLGGPGGQGLPMGMGQAQQRQQLSMGRGHAGMPQAGRPGGAGPPPASANPLGGMRELRVEDALLYLDDVKREFGDRPRVYNEFLAIMKNFKSQEVDTPGVIERVSKLFNGYDNLILGFNKFLPDGYKITATDLERLNKQNQEQEQAATREAQAAQAQQVALQKAQQVQAQAVHAQAQAAALQRQQQVQQQQGLQHRLPPGQQKPPPGQTQKQPPHIERPQVEKQHIPQPAPSASATPAQQKPAATGRGLPTNAGRGGRGAGRGGRGRGLPTAASAAGRVGAQPASREGPRPAAAASAPAARAESQQARAQESSSQQQRPQGAAQAAPQQAQQPPPVEFDHAISYVTTIKRRFANDPTTYHQFLDILHTYQKEQRGIKQVLEEVARLFADHPDLLKEFTFFLPDAVQEQAKERLHRAAAESEARQAAERAKQMGQQDKQSNQGAQRGGAHQKFIDLSEGQVAAEERESPSRGTKRPYSTTTKAAVAAAAPMAVAQPESYTYNSAVERQFFDSAREALTSYSRDGGQAWAEFLKCLDMYAQEILSRQEMLNFVEPLLGKRNTKLFEEFKRILNAAGTHSGQPPSLEDAWYSVPLSEIDFSRCRRCSPSYRALPRDYPAPPCSDRSEEEKKVLNDIWVSLPVGSEESYTFRHMRRNTYEEILFRCEDERFEIDMVIDSNATTLHRLEPIAKEIAQLAKEEAFTADLHAGNKPSDRSGLGGKRFRYTFDKNILGVVHRNSIARIYGDAGQEMLELMVKNPTVAIPVVVKRLRQKNDEWLVVRERLNHHWKELAKLNYYRSLDHRSLTWRTTDKRATSTRTLVAEIKDRAVNGGKEGEAAIQAKLEKAKEEHGTFYEVTMGETLSKQLDLTYLPKPDRRIFTPHLSLMYESNTWAQRDAYRILSYALERGSISPADKERCHRLWIDLLGPWFNLSLNWMQKPAIAIQERSPAAAATKDDSALAPKITTEEMHVEEEDEDSMEDDAEADLGGAAVVTEELRKDTISEPDSSSGFLDHHPLPAGSHVSTLYGEGRIKSFRRSDKTYEVELPFVGVAYLRTSAVLCSVMAVERSDYTTQLRAEDRTKLERSTDMLVIGTQSLYLFFRLHQILVRRLNIAKRVAYSIADDLTLSTLVEQMEGDDKEQLGRRRYESFLSLVYALIDGGASMGTGSGGNNAAEGGKYEDRVRCLLGHGGYELATMDKLISHLLKNLQTMGNDETMWNLVELFRRHHVEGCFKPESFRQEAAYLSDGESVYAFQHCPLLNEDKSVLYFEYLGVISEEEEVRSVEENSVKRQKR